MPLCVLTSRGACYCLTRGGLADTYIEPDDETLFQINSMVQELISLEEAEDYDKADKLHSRINSVIKQIYS